MAKKCERGERGEWSRVRRGGRQSFGGRVGES